MDVSSQKDLSNILKHVAIIMDGNGRWAQSRYKIRTEGHIEGIKAVKRAVLFSVKHNIACLSLYAFSKENWKRPPSEVDFLFNIFISILDRKFKFLNKHNIKLNIIGDLSELSDKMNEKITKITDLSKNNTGLVLNIAINYSGRWDIIQATKQLVSNNLEINEINLNNYLSTSKCPDIDLIIRTGGDKRISNFFLWQTAYSELIFIDEYWPDFNDKIFFDSIEEFSKRVRRFGKL